jgi:E3 ubiquitin-protein ligase RNF19A
MKEISDLHYLSPSGCTFWGKKPWSRKKKILWQLGTLVGAPVGIALLAGIAVPAMIIGIPIWVGRKLYARFKTVSKHKRNIIITSGVAASVRQFGISFLKIFFKLQGRELQIVVIR